MGRRVVLGTVALAVFAVSLMVLTSVNVAADPAAWMDPNWTRRAPVTITNPGGALSTYQVRVVVPYDTDMKSDFSDLRFTDSDGRTLLPYWIENIAPPPAPPPSYATRMQVTSEWIFVGQDANGVIESHGYKGGVSYYYQGSSWDTSDYMEVTGYIIPTILDMYHINNDPVYLARALSMADWEVKAQAAGGTGSAIGYVYDTGQMMQGLLMAYRESSSVAYLNAAEWAADWILSRQVADGSYINCNDPDHDYHARVDWILLQLYQTTGLVKYRDAALKNLAWIYSNQNHVYGMYRTETYLHFINYVIEGMLESGDLLKTLDGGANVALGTQYVGSAKQAADALLGLQRSDGGMTSDDYHGNWLPGGSGNTVSGDGQMAHIWSRLFEMSGVTAYTTAAQKMISFVGSTQDISSTDPNIRGCLDNTYPAGGQKIPWAGKFFIDAMLNTPDPQITPPSPPPVTEAVVWVKLPTIPATGTKTIYVYYGNSAATSTSNGVAVFDFFDDFSGDLSKWTAVGGSWTIQNGELVASTNGFAQRLRANGYLFSDGIVDGRIMLQQGTNFEHGYAVRGQVDDGRQFYSCHITKNVGPLLRIWKLDYVGGTSHQIAASSSAPVTLNKWYDVELAVHGSAFEANALPDYPRISGTDPGGWSSGTFSLLSWAADTEIVHYDNIRIRQYASVEPTTVLGAEEASLVTITFEASGAGVPVSVNYEFGSSSGSVSISVGGSCNVVVPYGSTVSFSYASAVADGPGTQYVLEATNVASPLVNIVSDTTITGTYGTQYYLTMSTNFGTVTPAAGSHWCDAGSTVTISATSPSTITGERYVWNGWTGTGAGSYSGTNNPGSITMNGPITEAASWTHQYELTMSTNFGTVSPASGSHWYDAESTVTISATPPAAGAGEQYVFNGWTGTGTGSYSGTDNSATDAVTMNSPITETASWQHKYLLTVNTNPAEVGMATGSGWYESGTLVDIFAFDYIDIVAGESRYYFTGWVGDSIADPGNHLTTVTTGSAAETVTANYVVKYSLVVNTNPVDVDLTTGSGWYESGTLVPIQASEFRIIEPQVSRYCFVGWTGTGVSDPSDCSTIVTMGSAARTVTAGYVTQYYLTVSTDPDYAATTTGSGWYEPYKIVPITAAENSDIVAGQSRYHFHVWTGTGIGAPVFSSTTVLTAPEAKTVTANYVVQYYLTVSTNPAEVDSTGGSSWYESGTSANIQALLLVDKVAGESRYHFSGWTGTNIANPSQYATTVTMGPAAEEVTANYQLECHLAVVTNPADIDSTTGSGWWASGASVLISAPPYKTIVSLESRYYFVGWTGESVTDLAAYSTTVTIGSTGQTVTANYVVQYYLKVATSPSSVDSTGGTGWYESGTSVSITAPLVKDFVSGDSRWVFSAWTGDGIADPSACSTTVTMDAAAKTVTANYLTQYYLRVTTNPSSIDSTTGTGWYESGTSVEIGAPEFEIITPGVQRWYFTGWTGSGIADPAALHTSVTMGSASKIVTAGYSTQYCLTVTTNPSEIDSTTGSGWYWYGTVVTISAPEGQDIVAGESRYHFDKWSSGATADPYSCTTTVHIGVGSLTVTASYLLQYYLAVGTNPLEVDSATGSGWYVNGASVPVSAPEYKEIVPGEARFKFTGWSGDGIVNPTAYSTTVTIGAAGKTVTANYVVQYHLTVDTNPIEIDYTTGSGWYTSGTLVSIHSPSARDIEYGKSLFRFTCWTGDGITNPAAYSTTVMMGSAAKTVTANYVTQFRITVSSSFGNPTSSAWVNQGSDFTVSVTSPYSWYPTRRETCIGYTLDGSASTPGTSYTFVDVQASHSIAFEWQLQEWIVFAQNGVESDYTGTVMTIDSLGYDRSGHADWHDSGSSVDFSFGSELVVLADGKQYSLTGVDASSPLEITAPQTVTGTYKVQYWLTLDTDPAGITLLAGAGWHDSSTSVSVAAPQYVPVNAWSRYAFSSWTGATGPYDAGLVFMDGPEHVVANYVLEILDVTPPVTICELEGAAGNDGWYLSEVTFSLSAVDDLGYVDSIHYRIDGGEWNTYADPVLVSLDGCHLVEYYSVDNSGNTEGANSVAVKIDTVAPVISGAPTSLANGNGWYNHDVTVHFDATDIGGSGVASCTADQTLTAEAADQSVTGTAVDLAGNSASFTVSGINIDKTPPTISGAATTYPNANGWYKTDVTVHFVSADLDGSGVKSCTPDQTLTAEAKDQSVTGTAVDLAGNSASATVSGINIDKTPPTISGAATTSPNANGWYKTDVTVHFTVADGLSGVLSAPADMVLSGEGAAQSTGATVYDLAGNSASTTVSGINIDKTLPVVTATYPDANSNGWYMNDVTVDFSATDAVSTVWIDPIDVTLYEGKAQSATGTATDLAGNVGTLTVSGINIDKTAPAVTILTPLDGHYYKTGDVPAGTYTATDLNGVVSHTEAGWANSPDGSYTYTVTATDAAGNVGSAHVHYTVDNIAPAVTINSPQSGKYYKSVNVPVAGDFSVVEINPYTTAQAGWSDLEGVHTYTVTATDGAGNVGTASVTYTVDNAAPVVAINAPTAGSYYKSVNVPAADYDVLDTNPCSVVEVGYSTSEGIQTYTVTATDGAGNIGTASVTYTVDNTAPVVAIDAPMDGAYYKTSVVPAAHYTVTEINPWTPVEVGYSTVEGIHTYTVTATDDAGNVGTASVTYTVDNTAPAVTILTPLAGHYYKTGDVPAGTYTATDLNGVVSHTEAGWANSPDGSQTYTVTATDAAGNVGSDSVTYTVDNIAPAVTISAPVDDAYYKSVNVPTAGDFTVFDANPYTTVEAGWSDVEGTQAYWVTATDSAGNVGTASVTYTVDNTAPVVTINSPTAGSYYKTVNVPAAGDFTVLDASPYTTVEAGWSDLEGVQTYTVTVTDSAGNVGSAHVHYTVDNTAPAVTISAPVNGAYYKSVNVPTGAFLVVDANPCAVVESGYSTSEGVHTYTVTATDGAGNVGTASVTYTVDNTAPAVTITSPLSGAYYTTAHVPAAGYTVSELNPYTVVASGYLTSEGVQTYTVTATDGAGNVGSASVTYTVDNTPPIITGAATIFPNSNGWWNADVTVHFIAADGLSGIASVTSDQVVSTEGYDQEVTGTAVDRAGNSATFTVHNINVDKTAPTITGSRTPDANSHGWNNVDVTVSFSVSDAVSGLDPVTIPSPTTLGEGAGQSVTGTVVDLAGNSASATVSGINIDKTAPTITGSRTPGANSHGWNNVDVKVSFAASDSLSGVFTVTDPVILSSEGAGQSVTGTVVDLAGNSASTTVSGINIDKTPPTISGAATTSPNANGWYKTDVTVHFTVSDGLSGVLSAPADVVLSGEGAAQSTGATVYDLAGNSASTTVSGINIDLTPPVVTAAYPDANANGWYNADVTVDFSATDALSAVWIVPIDVTLGEGKAQSATGTATDLAGNVGTLTVSGINIDKTAPVVSISAPANGGHYDVGTLPPLAYMVSDNLDPSPSVVAGVYLATLGVHTVTVTATDHAGNVGSASATYTVGETALIYTGAKSCQYSDPVTVAAKLTDVATGLPLSGKTISFAIGSQSASVTTDANGVATTSITLNQQMGSYTVSAAFVGSTDYLGSSDQAPFTINQERAVPEYTGVTIVPTTKNSVTGPIQLQATIYEDPDSYFGDLTKITVTFMIDGNVVGTEPSPVTVGAPGIGVAQLTTSGLGEGDHLVIVKINYNNYYTIFPTSDVVVLEVYVPTGSFVTGGGWITDSGSKGSFGFTAKYLKSGSVQGHMTYVYRVNGLDYIVKSTALSGLGITGTHAYFEGKCVVRIYDPATGATSWNDGNYKFRIDVYDNGEPGSKDAFQITVRDKNGVVWHQAGVPPPGVPPSEYGSYGVLKGGNIVVHVEKSARSASVAAQSLNPALATAIFSLLAVGLLLLKGLVALARKPSKISQMSASVKGRAANRDRSSVRRTLHLPCTLAELD